MSTPSIGRLTHPSPPLDPSVFPVTRRWAYCDHAAIGPLPQPTRDAVVAALDAQTGDGCAGILDVESRLESVRLAVAQTIGADADEIAFMRSTSDGALVVANGLDWRDGDEVLLSDNEFGANAFPWLNLHDIGVRPVLIRAPGQRLTVETLERMASDRTRVVTVSQVGFSDGYRHDLRALGAWCKAHKVIFAVDAIQGFGHLPIDVGSCEIDVCYFGVAKWLLSPQGLSVVYVRRELAERLRPALCSWRSVKEPMRFLDYAQPLLPGARRFDGATINYPAAIGFSESLRLITEAGLANIEAHVLRLGDRFIAGVRSLGLPLVTDVEPAVRSAIVVAGRGGTSVEELQRRARDARVQVTIRDTGVRFAPHGYNTDDEVDRVLSILYK